MHKTDGTGRVGYGWYAALMLEGDSRTTVGMPIWKKIVVGGVAIILIKRGLRDSGVCLSHIKSGIYNSVKYGLKDMRHKNANIYVVRKYINSKNSIATTRACTGHHLVDQNVFKPWGTKRPYR